MKMAMTMAMAMAMAMAMVRGRERIGRMDLLLFVVHCREELSCLFVGIVHHVNSYLVQPSSVRERAGNSHTTSPNITYR